MDPQLCTSLVTDTTHTEEAIREAASLGLANALADNGDYVPAVLQTLIALYEEKLYVSELYLSLPGLHVTLDSM